MKCPNCASLLHGEVYQRLPIERCGSCQGCWLETAKFAQALEHHEKTFSPELIRDTLRKAKPGVPKEELQRTRSCPACSQQMKPVNYSYSSGVIVDVCSEHGLWFDRSELERVEAFHDEWEAKKPDIELEYAPALKKIRDDYVKEYAQRRAETREKLFLPFSLSYWLDKLDQEREEKAIR